MIFSRRSFGVIASGEEKAIPFAQDDIPFSGEGVDIDSGGPGKRGVSQNKSKELPGGFCNDFSFDAGSFMQKSQQFVCRIIQQWRLLFHHDFKCRDFLRFSGDHALPFRRSKHNAEQKKQCQNYFFHFFVSCLFPVPEIHIICILRMFFGTVSVHIEDLIDFPVFHMAVKKKQIAAVSVDRSGEFA